MFTSNETFLSLSSDKWQLNRLANRHLMYMIQNIKFVKRGKMGLQLWGFEFRGFLKLAILLQNALS